MKKFILVTMFLGLVAQGDTKEMPIEKRVKLLEDKVEWLKEHSEKTQLMLEIISEGLDSTNAKFPKSKLKK